MENKSRYVELSLQPILDRLKERLDARNDSELATRLGIRPQLLSSWRKRNMIPWAACARLAWETGIDLHWIIDGQDRQALDPDVAGLATAHVAAAITLLEAGDIDAGTLGELFSDYYEQFSMVIDKIAGIRSRERGIELVRDWSQKTAPQVIAQAVELHARRQLGDGGEGSSYADLLEEVAGVREFDARTRRYTTVPLKKPEFTERGKDEAGEGELFRTKRSRGTRLLHRMAKHIDDRDPAPAPESKPPRRKPRT